MVRVMSAGVAGMRGCERSIWWRRCLGLLGGTLVVFVVALAFRAPAALAQTCQPEIGAEGVAPFTVWYCAGDATGRRETEVAAQLLDRVWSEETRPEPDGLGPPIAPETNDGRISVYVTAPGVEVQLGQCPEFCHTVSQSAGVAVPAAPFVRTPAGSERSSALMILNERAGMNDATVIHEFFHVLEFAHSNPAAFSWLGETSATWAENWYAASDTSRVGFFREFQRRAGIALNRKNVVHEYGAYVWLVWLSQSARRASAIFRLWSALEPARSDRPAAIDPLVRNYLARIRLGWASSFKSFAVEDLNRDLPSATPQLFRFGPFGDPAVSLGITPRWVRTPWILGLGARRTVVNLPHLSAQYEHVRAIARTVRAVTVSSSRIKPWGDVVVLAHSRTGFGWHRRDLNNASVTFCLRTRRGNIDQLYIVADNHDDQRGHSGASYTVTGRKSC
jgi:hypothetical protein